MAMIKELRYWHKVTVRGENKLLAEIMGVLRLKTEEGGGGWLGKVKEKLFEIGMGFLWERPGLVSHKRFKKMVARRIRDMAFQKQVEKAREKPSLQYFLSKNPGAIMWPKIRELGSNLKRRVVVKCLIKAHEELIIRTEGEKKCALCKSTLPSGILRHRLMECESLSERRAALKIENEESVITDLIDWYVDKISKSGGHKWATMMTEN